MKEQDERLILEARRRGAISDQQAIDLLDSLEPSIAQQALSTAGGVAKSTATGLAKGAIGATVAFPGNMADLGQLAVSAMTNKVPPPDGGGFLPRTKDVVRLLERQGVPFHEAQGPLEAYTEAGAEGVGSLVNPFAKGAKVLSPAQAVAGVAMGVGGKAGSTLTPDDPIVGNLLGISPAMALLMRSQGTPHAVTASREYLKDLGPSGLTAAAASRDAATRATGLPALLSQGSDRSTALDAIVQQLSGSTEGAGIRRVLQEQAAAAPDLIRGNVRGVSQLGAGQMGTPHENAILQAGKAVMGEKKAERSALTAPFYEAARADKVDPTPIIEAIFAARQRLNIPPVVPEGKAMKNLQEIILAAKGRPVSVMDLNTISRQAKIAAKKAYDGGNDIKGNAQKAVADAIDATTMPASASLKEGNLAHARATEALIKPLTKGKFGEAFPSVMMKGEKGDFSTWVKVLESSSPSDIAQLAGALNKVHPEAFPMIAKESFSRAAQKALGDLSGRQGAKAYSVFSDAVMGPPGSDLRKRFLATMDQVAAAKGLDRAAVSKGANDLADAFRVLSRGHGGEATASELVSNAGKGVVSRTLKAFGSYTPIRTVGRMMESAAKKETFAALAEALTSPEGLKMFQDLSTFSVGANRARNLAQALISLSAQEAAAGNLTK